MNESIASTKVQLLQTLHPKGEKMRAANIQPSEKVLVKLQGRGCSLVVTDKRIYILKYRGRRSSFAVDHRNVIGIKIGETFIVLSRVGVFQIVTAGTQEDSNIDAISLVRDNTLTFSRRHMNYFQQAANLCRDLADKAHT